MIVMHQEVELPGIGDAVEFVGARLPEGIPQPSADNLREYDGCTGRVVGLFTDSQGVKCATVQIKGQSSRRTGKRYFPLSALKKRDAPS